MADLGPPPTPAAIVRTDAAQAQTPDGLPGQTTEQVETGPVMPYGPPIYDAVQRGDLAEMEAVAAAARLALAAGDAKFASAARGVAPVPGAVTFTPVTAQNEGAVTTALATLESAIARLKQQQGSR
jgi:hypothetical protein